MAANTGILWTDHTFNGWWGCTKVGPGCDHCYALDLDKRSGGDHWGVGAERRLTSDRNWNEPIRWNRIAEERGVPFKVFASSMCDVFDNEVPQFWRERLWELIEKTPHLRWQILTKRIGNARDMLPERWWRRNMPRHVGIMATVVNQREVERDVPKLILLKADWDFRWVGLSIEPMLGPINLTNIRGHAAGMPPDHDHFSALHLPCGIDWVIWGGESGPQSRPCDLAWGLSLAEQCERAGVAFFAKQAGDHAILDGVRTSFGKKGHDMDLWPEALRIRQFPEGLA